MMTTPPSSTVTIFENVANTAQGNGKCQHTSTILHIHIGIHHPTGIIKVSVVPGYCTWYCKLIMSESAYIPVHRYEPVNLTISWGHYFAS